MSTKTLQILLAVVSVAALAAGGAWYHASEALYASRAQRVDRELGLIATLVKENQTFIHYLAKIRRDGGHRGDRLEKEFL